MSSGRDESPRVVLGADLKILAGRGSSSARVPRDLGENALVVDPRGVVVTEHRELARYLQLVGRRVQAHERHLVAAASVGSWPRKRHPSNVINNVDHGDPDER